MMKKIHELKKERAEFVESMRSIIEVCEKEKRTKTEEEVKRWDDLDAKIEGINTQIEDAQRMEDFNKYLLETEDAGEKREKSKMAKRYDLSKAIMGFRNHTLSGVEKEVHEIGVGLWERSGQMSTGLIVPEFIFSKRANEETTTTGAGHIPTQVAPLDVVASPAMYDILGATVYNGLTSKISLPFSKGNVAAKVAEEGTAAQSVATKSSGTLEASRFQGWQIYSWNYLSQSAVMPQLLADMIESIDRAISKELLAEAVAAAPLAGYLTSTAKAAVTYPAVLKLLAALETDTFKSGAFVASKALYHKLEGTEKVSGAGRFIIEGGILNGEKAFGSSQLAVHDTDKYDLIYGDWARSYVGFYSGGIEILVDPYTASNTGQTKLTWHRLADTAVNPYAFASIRNADIA